MTSVFPGMHRSPVSWRQSSLTFQVFRAGSSPLPWLSEQPLDPTLPNCLGLPCNPLLRCAWSVFSPPSPSLQISDERRVGKECVSTCRSRGSPYNSKQKNQKQIMTQYPD